MNIISYCKISNEGVELNGEKIFAGNKTDIFSYFDEIYKHFNINYQKFSKMDLMSKAGFLTAEILLSNSFSQAFSQPQTQYSPYDCGVLTANRSSSLNTDLKYFETTKQIPSPSLFVYTLPNAVNAEICIRNNFKGENLFFIASDFCSSGIIEYANALFTEQNLKFCLCGQVEILDENCRSIYFAVDDKPAGIAEFSRETVAKLI